MTLNEYLESMLGKNGVTDLKRAKKSNQTIVVTGGYQTGKTTLVRLLKKHGYNAVEDIHEAHIVKLTKPLTEMVRDFDDTIDG